jgi:hypothetical protein
MENENGKRMGTVNNPTYPGYLQTGNTHQCRKARGKITAIFEFNPSGILKSIFLNSQDERDQFILQRGIERLIKPYHFSWVKRLFRNG